MNVVRKKRNLVIVPVLIAIGVVILSCGGGYYEDGPQDGPQLPPTSMGADSGDPADPSYFYFSYDDSASTIAAEAVAYMIDHNQRPTKSLGRPWEFLNYEASAGGLKNAAAPAVAAPFSASMGLVKTGSGSSTWELGVSVVGDPVSLPREELVLTIAVDVSASMADFAGVPFDSIASKLALVQYSMLNLLDYLQAGDRVTIVTFSDEAVLASSGENLDMGAGADRATFGTIVNGFQPDAGTNLEAGLNLAYDYAEQYFDATKINRVLLVTDAMATVGATDANRVAEAVVRNNAEGILFSGIGVGKDYDDDFLNTLTDKGKGATMALISKRDGDRIFDERANALFFVAARDVRFRLDYPSTWSHVVSAAEQTSTNPDDIQPVTFSLDTSQYFFEKFDESNTPAGPDNRLVTLTITWKDQSGSNQTASISDTVDNLLASGEGTRIDEARILWLTAGVVSGTVNTSDAAASLATHYAGFPAGTSDIYDRWRPRIDTLINLVNTSAPESTNNIQRGNSGTAADGRRWTPAVLP